jgi:hypothetical protein
VPAQGSSGVILDFVYLVPRHSPMQPDTGFVEFISVPLSPILLFPLVNFSSPAPLTLSEMAPAEGSRPYGPSSAFAQECGREGSEPCRERGAKEGKGG